MSIKEKLRSSEGFTLIETMIAMFLILFIVEQMALVSIYASYTSTLARRITTANMLADEAVEKTRNRAYENIQLKIDNIQEASCEAGKDYDTAVANVYTCPPRSPLPPVISNVYRRYRIVRPLDSAGNIIPLATSNRSEVDVIVDFIDARGNEQQIRVSSVISRY